MNKIINKIMSIMDNIEYGFKDEFGNNIKDTNPQKRENDFFNTVYYLQTPEELLKSKCGVCWDQVELERKLFQENNIRPVRKLQISSFKIINSTYKCHI